MRPTVTTISLPVLIGVLALGWLAAAQAGNLDAGLEVHKGSCLKCHGETGKGDGPTSKLLKDKPADWTNKESMSKYSDSQLVQIIKEGGAASGKSKLMPAFGGKLNDQQINDVIAYVRSLQE